MDGLSGLYLNVTIQSLQGFPLSITVKQFWPLVTEFNNDALYSWQIADHTALESQLLREAVVNHYPTPVIHAPVIPHRRLEEDLFFKLREIYHDAYPTAALSPNPQGSTEHDLSLVARRVTQCTHQRLLELKALGFIEQDF